MTRQDRSPQTPRLARWLVRGAAPRDRRDEIAADLDELFAARAALDPRLARQRYWEDAMSLLRPAPRRATPRPLSARVHSTLAGDALQDVGYAVRTLSRARGFAATAIVTLALGIGANVGVFSVVDAVLLRPLPYPSPDELVLIDGVPFAFGAAPMTMTRAVEESPALAGIGLFMPGGLNLGVEPEAVRIPAASVSAGFFKAFALPFALGRPFTKEEEAQGANTVVVLGHELWRERFGSQPAVLGRQVQLNDRAFTIVGVAPAGFDFPRGAAAWIPPMADRQIGGQAFAPDVIGRASPGGSPERVRDALEQLEARSARPGDEPPKVTVQRLHADLTGGVRPVLLVLIAGAATVLLIACTNAANLLLARVAARDRELQIRRALGASRWRLLRQLVTESLVLSAIAGAAALLVAWWTLHAVRLIVPPTLPGVSTLHLDGRAMTAAGLLSIASAILFGLGPALSALPCRESSPLRERRSIGGSRAWRLMRGALVAAEVAMAIALVAGTSVLVRTIAKLVSIDLGFRTERVLTLQVTLPFENYKGPQVVRFVRDALGTLQTVPGVESAAATNMLPGSSEIGVAFPLRALDNPERTTRGARWMSASPDLFRTLGMPLQRGRSFTGADGTETAKVIVLSAGAARQLWPDGSDPIGRRVVMTMGRSRAEEGVPKLIAATDRVMEVVGVVGDVRASGPDGAPTSHAYLPVDQNPPFGSVQFAVKTRGDPAVLAGAVRDVFARHYPTLPPYNVRTLDEAVAAYLAERRFGTTAMLVFALLALLLSSVGLFGLLAHLVEQRRAEIGIRMALGADTARVRREVVLTGLRHALAGLPLGLLGAWWLARTIAGLVKGAEPLDPLALAAVAGGMIAIAGAASFVPARRATRVDPLCALRAE